MVGNACLQSGRHPQRHVPRDEIVDEEVQRNRVLVILQFFGKGIRQQSESTHPHSHRQVLPLHERRVHLVFVRVADLLDRVAPDARGRAVPAFRARRPVNLVEHGVIYFALEAGLNRREVSSQAVRRNLDAIRQPARKIGHEQRGEFAVSRTDQPRRNELGIRVDSRPRPHAADAFVPFHFGRYVGLFRMDERPDFVELEHFAIEVPQRVVLVASARPARVDKQLRDCVDTHSGHSRRGAERAPFRKGSEDRDPLSDG